VRRWAQETKLADGRRVIDQEWVQTNLARVHAGLEFLRLMNWKVAWMATDGQPLDVAQASAVKVFGTEFYLEAFRLLMEVLGPVAYLRRGSPQSILKSRLERNYRSLIILTFGGGTNEIQRDLIGMFGLGLPRASR
jgi:alkylation response protein AidB-like acyl-CoA dehydrogenase